MKSPSMSSTSSSAFDAEDQKVFHKRKANAISDYSPIDNNEIQKAVSQLRSDIDREMAGKIQPFFISDMSSKYRDRESI